MKHILPFVFYSFCFQTLFAQKVQTPDQIYGALFRDVQMSRIFADNKTFVDAIPKRNPKSIVQDYLKVKNNPAVRFSLKMFVTENFTLPENTPEIKYVQQEEKIETHIKNLWGTLKKEADVPVAGSSLLPLPHPYIVPGGRFREIYYWDSYFTMLGLKESGEISIIENMIDNFAFLINTYGHIPNGNRSYYLSRSQPPFFSLMVELLATIKGDEVYKKYGSAIEKEYAYWMSGGKTGAKSNSAEKKLVKLSSGEILNRYFDALYIPRQESWADDVETAKKNDRNKGIIYNHLRSAAESGWDFSSRWLADENDLSTIETTDIIPVDLNCLLYKTEKILQKYFEVIKNTAKAKSYKMLANKRSRAIIKFCYSPSDQVFYDFNWKKRAVTKKFTPASFFPFWLSIFNEEDRISIHQSAVKLEKELLFDGGVATSTFTNKQQWDAPNGWAPLQWVVSEALYFNDHSELAKNIATRWINHNRTVYKKTGKLMEKYNVIDTNLEAGGGNTPAKMALDGQMEYFWLF